MFIDNERFVHYTVESPARANVRIGWLHQVNHELTRIGRIRTPLLASPLPLRPVGPMGRIRGLKSESERIGYFCRPNMRIITSITGVEAVKGWSHDHMFRTKSVISIPVSARMTTMDSRLSTFQIE